MLTASDGSETGEAQVLEKRRASGHLPAGKDMRRRGLESQMEECWDWIIEPTSEPKDAWNMHPSMECPQCLYVNYKTEKRAAKCSGK